MSDSTATNPITGTYSMSPFVFSYSINTETNEITVSLSFDGLDCGTSTLLPVNAQGTFFKNLDIKIVEGNTSADFQNSTLTAEVELKEYGQIIYENRGTIATW